MAPPLCTPRSLWGKNTGLLLQRRGRSQPTRRISDIIHVHPSHIGIVLWKLVFGLNIYMCFSLYLHNSHYVSILPGIPLVEIWWILLAMFFGWEANHKGLWSLGHWGPPHCMVDSLTVGAQVCLVRAEQKESRFWARFYMQTIFYPGVLSTSLLTAEVIRSGYFFIVCVWSYSTPNGAFLK